MAPYGTLCSEKYLNFTKQFSSQRFIIFVIFCIAISQILDQTVVFRSNVFRYSWRRFGLQLITNLETTAVFFFCCLYTQHFSIQLQGVFFSF